MLCAAQEHMAAPARHKAAPHHLSQKSDAHGWVESIARLTETTPATELLMKDTENGQVRSFISQQMCMHAAIGYTNQVLFQPADVHACCNWLYAPGQLRGHRWLV